MQITKSEKESKSKLLNFFWLCSVVWSQGTQGVKTAGVPKFLAFKNLPVGLLIQEDSESLRDTALAVHLPQGWVLPSVMEKKKKKVAVKHPCPDREKSTFTACSAMAIPCSWEHEVLR